jgi:hypothetical protein
MEAGTMSARIESRGKRTVYRQDVGSDLELLSSEDAKAMNDGASDLDDGLWVVLVASGNGVVTDALEESASRVTGDSAALPSDPGI